MNVERPPFLVVTDLHVFEAWACGALAWATPAGEPSAVSAIMPITDPILKRFTGPPSWLYSTPATLRGRAGGRLRGSQRASECGAQGGQPLTGAQDAV